MSSGGTPPEQSLIEKPSTTARSGSPGVTPADLESLVSLAKQIVDPELSEFLQEIANRIKEAGPDFDGETSFNFVEEMVDRLDDLRAIQKNQPEKTTKDLESFRQMLMKVLSQCEVDLIHSADWDASLQRAIAKEPIGGIEAPAILRFGSTGIRRRGELLRKQEVVLAVPL